MLQLDFIYEGGRSKRYHTVETLKNQNIAEHSFNVAWWCEAITQGSARKELIMAALAHDLAEHMCGDMPAQVKRDLDLSEKLHTYENAFLKTAGLTYEDDLYEGERFVLKLADCFDGMVFCINELQLGNRKMGIVFTRFHSYVQSTLRKYEMYEAAQSWSFCKETVEDCLLILENKWKENL